MQDDAESFWDILESDAACQVLTGADQTEVEKAVENLKSQRTVAKQCQERIFNKVKALRQKKGQKQTFTGSKTPFPRFTPDMTVESLLAKLPAERKLECDRFNGRWKCSWRAPETLAWKTISGSRGVKGACGLFGRTPAMVMEFGQWIRA